MRAVRTPLDRFHSLTSRDERSECVIWTGARNEQGYGLFGINRKMRRAHRWIYEQCVGPIPDGMVVMHECDNPSCVNINHLRAGTQSENVRDCFARGRANRTGPRPRPGNAKLTADLVVQIRNRRAAGEGRNALAAEFGISGRLLTKIVTGQLWKDVGGPLTPNSQRETRCRGE